VIRSDLIWSEQMIKRTKGQVRRLVAEQRQRIEKLLLRGSLTTRQGDRVAKQL
jgi:hypothetical protein